LTKVYNKGMTEQKKNLLYEIGRMVKILHKDIIIGGGGNGGTGAVPQRRWIHLRTGIFMQLSGSDWRL